MSCLHKTICLTFNRPPRLYFWFLAKVVYLEVVHPPKIYQNTTFHGPMVTGASFASTSIVWNSHHRHIQKVRPRKLLFKFNLLVGMSTIFHCTKPHLSKCNSSRVVFIKPIVNFKFQPSAVFVFLVSRKNGVIKVVHPLKIYQDTKFHGPTLTGASFASTSKVWTSAILEWLQLWH